MAHEKQDSESRRRVTKYFKRGLWLVVGGTIVAAVVMAAQPKPALVERGVVTRGELIVTVNEDGRSRVADRYVVSAPLTGNLARLELHPGDRVKQGDILARLVPLRSPLLDTVSRSQAEQRVAASRAATKQVQAQIERAEAALEFAQKEAQRIKTLVENRAVSEIELERALLDERARQAELTSAQFGSKVASHELQMALAALNFDDKSVDSAALKVTSPITGIVLSVIQASEGVVQAGTPLLELGDPTALEVVVDVLTSDAVHIQPGSKATIEQWGGDPLAATVRLIEPAAFSRVSALGVNEQRVNAVLELNAPYESWRKLGDGYRVEARIEIYRSSGALLVPQSSLFRHEGGWAVYAIDSLVAARKRVEVGRRNDRLAEVLSGLSEGQAVVIHPSDKVVDGGEVKLLND